MDVCAAIVVVLLVTTAKLLVTTYLGGLIGELAWQIRERRPLPRAAWLALTWPGRIVRDHSSEGKNP